MAFTGTILMSLYFLVSVKVKPIITAVIAVFMANTIAIPKEVVTYIIAMGVILSISFSLITIAPRYMPAAEVGMIMPLETVLGSLIAWYIIKEEPTMNALIGGSIVIVTLFLHSWYSTNQAHKLEKI